MAAKLYASSTRSISNMFARRCWFMTVGLFVYGTLTGVLLLYFFGDYFPLKQQITRVKTHMLASERPPSRDIFRIPAHDELEKMSEAELQNLYQSYIVSPQVTCSNVQRMGLITDGGWDLCLDQRFAPPKNGCLVYSYGIRFDFSFDDAMEDYGCEVHSFDPSMKDAKEHVRSDKVYFHPIGVSGVNETVQLKGNKDPKEWKLYTIKNHRKMFKHSLDERQLNVVKMDVEGYEYSTLMTALDDGSLDDVTQLNFETHLSFDAFPKKSDYLKFLGLLRKVYDTGFRIYTSHRNYIYSSFRSPLDGKYHVKCHEVHTVRVADQNGVALTVP